MVIVDIVVTVLMFVIVTFTAGGVVVIVTTEPVLSVFVVITGGGVELVIIGDTRVLPEEEEVVEELLATELEAEVRLLTFAPLEVVATLEVVMYEVRLMIGPLELDGTVPPHDIVTVLGAAFVTVTVAVGEHT